MAEAFIARELGRIGVEGMVRSAGVSADPGSPPLDDVVKVMHEFGIDVSEHQSRLLTEELVRDSDLVVGLTREHLREAIVLDPGAFDRTFTLKELVRRSQLAGPRPADAAVGPWLASLVAHRQIVELLGASPDDDVDDPVGRPRAIVRETAAELADLSTQGVSLIWPSALRR